MNEREVGGWSIIEELETEGGDTSCLYRWEASPGTNGLTFVPGVLEMAPPCPFEIAFVPGSSSTRYKCYYLHREKIPGTNKKSGQRQMLDSLVMRGRSIV
jgi:hypothetical protein